MWYPQTVKQSGGGSQEITPISTTDYANLTPQQKSNGQVYLVSPPAYTSPDYTASNWQFASEYSSVYTASIDDGKLVFKIISGGGDYNSYASAMYKTAIDLTNIDHITMVANITYIGSPREIQIGVVDTLPSGSTYNPTFSSYETLTEDSWTLPIDKTIELDTSALSGTYYFGIKARGKTEFTAESIAFYLDTGNIPNEIYHMNQKFSQYPNGSSGGGHTILNDSGTELTQEDNLQFKGAYTHDDSTNGKTVVEVTRVMTSEEYALLTDAEKKGVIVIEDEEPVPSGPRIRSMTPTAYENLSLAEKENGDAYFVSQQLNEPTDLSPTGYNYVTPGTSGNVRITYEDSKIIVDQSGNTQGYYCAIHCRTNVPSNTVSVRIKYKLTGIRGTGVTSTIIGMQTSTSDITAYAPNRIDGGDVTIPSSDIGVEKTQIITITSSQTVHVALYTTSAAFEVSEISYVVDNSNDIPTLYQDNKQYSHDVVANPTGTATDSLSSLKIDGSIYSVGGSGSGGHTILDDGGTSLATESNLQFKGTYTHDDSTNSATVVEVTRSMTKEQYSNLSDDEKLGVIEVIDEDDVKVCYDIEGVLRAGEDRITFSHEAINDNSTLDPYTNEVGVSPVNAFLSVDTSYTKATIEVVTTSVSGSGASVSVTYKDEEGSTISTQSLTYDDVIGEENAYVLDDILEVFYDTDNLSWVVKALSLCGYDGSEYETGDVISTWVYSESVDMEIEQYSTVGSVTYVFPVQNHDVAVKVRITNKDCGPIDVAPHIVDYSTEEQNTGVRWLDGKYVYQKTVVVQGPVSISGSGYSINTGILNGGDLIDMRVTMQRNDTSEHFLNTYLNTDDLSWGTNCILNSDLTVLKVTGGNHYQVKNILVTLQYTKSTS